MENVNWRTLQYFDVHEVEKFNWRTLLYFIRTKWKMSAGELYHISCPPIGKVRLERSIILHVHKVESLTG